MAEWPGRTCHCLGVRHCPRVCFIHEDYLFPGQSNTETFKCRDSANQCISMAGRCNGHAQCHDESDELGCDTPYGKPANVGTEYPCEVNFLTDVHFQCASGQCVEKVGLCNGIDNCGDGSDEASCSGNLVIDTEATSGRTVTMQRVSTTDSVFYGRDYSFESLGSFEHMNMIKYSNNDKQTDHEHVMMKLRTEEPVTVYIVQKEDHGLSWLESENYHLTAREGVTFGGLHSSTDSELVTRHLHHKEWGLAPGIVEGAATVGTNGNPLPALDFASQPTHFTASVVHSRSYEAGTINIPGNNGGEGSFLIFVDKASAQAQEPSFNWGAMHTNSCPDGASVAEANCLAVVQGLLGSGQTQGRSHLVAGSWGHVPPGCSSQTHFTYGQDGDFAAHFNRNANGVNDGGYTPACTTTCQHLTNQDVVGGTFSHLPNDGGNNQQPSDEACAASCTARAACTAWVRQPSSGNCWLSQQSVVTFEGDSDRTTGLRCN